VAIGPVLVEIDQRALAGLGVRVSADRVFESNRTRRVVEFKIGKGVPTMALAVALPRRGP
jgi:hypothetical protein